MSHWHVKYRRWLLASTLLVLACAIVAITSDEAEREYNAFLRGDEDDSSDAQRLAHIDRAIELAPDRASYYVTRATFRLDRHESAAALTDLDRAIALEDRPYFRYLRALTLCHLGGQRRALEDFDRAIAAQPDNTQFYRGRALARIAQGRASDALADGQRMVAHAPRSPESFFTRGSAFAALGRHSAAIADFDEALTLNPELIFVWKARAQSRERLGDAEGARKDRAHAERISPRLPRVEDPFHHY